MDYCMNSNNENCLLQDCVPTVDPVVTHPKIPRPPNAFMLFANDHRKTMAHLYPAESNKQISRRLGQTWKELNLVERNFYFQRAKDIDLEHKRKYPGYVYNPKDARVRKAIKSTLRDRSYQMLPRSSIRKNSCMEFYQDFGQNCNQQPRTYESTDLDSSKPCTITSATQNAITHANIFGLTEEDRQLFENEKPILEAAESYNKMGKFEEVMRSSYLPISTTKFIQDPGLFTNNVNYHKEYIIKYFNHIPDYETYNVVTGDGISFPYVIIGNQSYRQ